MELENLKVKVVDIKPNDILIINIDKLLTRDQINHIKEQLTNVFPNNKCLILCQMELIIGRIV